jgi:ATP-dependent Lon protease
MKAKTNDPTADDIYKVGTVSTIIQLLRLPDGTVKVLVEGLRRARITEFLQSDDFFYVETEDLEDKVNAFLQRDPEPRHLRVGDGKCVCPFVNQ